MSNFDRAFDLLLAHEGGYSDQKADPGGKTKFGITEAVARQYGYRGEMKDLPVEMAKAIYKGQYWDDLYDQLPFMVAFNVFDGGVNSGVSRSVKWLQKSVGVSQDGLFGPNTLAATISQNPFDVVRKYNAERLMFLTGLSIWPDFGRGWARRVAHNLKIK